MKAKSINTIIYGAQIPKNFPDFVDYFTQRLDGQKNNLIAFLGIQYELKFIIQDYHTFAFNPKTTEIIIPLNFLENFHQNLLQGSISNDKATFTYTFDDLKFSIYHELSHFRDMIFEKDQRKSMIDILSYVGNQKISYWSDKIIPIWEYMHTIVNCIDDIIVNTEVCMDIWASIDDAHLKWFYMYNLFADPIEQAWWEYTIYKWRLIYVWAGKWEYIINDSNNVDYSSYPRHTAFPYFLLRSFMVPDQHISLPPHVENILFLHESRKQRPTRKQSIKIMIENMTTYLTDLQKNWDSKVQERINKLLPEYSSIIEQLKETLTNKNTERRIQQAIQKTNTTRNNIWSMINIIDIIKLFLASRGKNKEKHSLDVSPWLRYAIYKDIFLPIQKWFIIMDLLKEDIPEKNQDFKKNETKDTSSEAGESANETKDTSSEAGESANETKDTSSEVSGSAPTHVSPSTAEKIKFLEDLEEQDKKHEEEKIIKKYKDQTKYNLNWILAWSNISKEAIDIVNHISEKYKDWIEDLIRFFIKELEQIARITETTEHLVRKGKLDTDKLRDYIVQDPSLSDIDTWKIYSKPESIEKIDKEFKKIDLTLAIDISGSTETFRGKHWIINIVSTIIFITMKHLASHIWNLLEDPDYTIPVEFVLYWDDLPYSSYKSAYRDKWDMVQVANLNEQLISLSWWTNDITAWQKIAYEFDTFLKENTEYVEEIQDWKRKPIILQIADTDVTENGVEYLKERFLKYLDPNIVESLPIKRIIVGTNIEHTIPKEKINDYQRGNWDTEVLPNWNILVKQIGIRSKNEILSQIKNLFRWFFDDMHIKKNSSM